MPPYTNVAKPTGTPYTNLAKPSDGGELGVGYATGVLGPPTYSVAYIFTGWTDISKPTGTPYTNINKPT